MSRLATGWLVLVPLAASAAVYGPIVGNYFFADDFLNLYRIVNVAPLEYVLTPHAGHVLLVRNALFWLSRTAVGPRADLFFATVLATHLLNVALLFATVHAFSGSARLACLGATLWGISPLHQGTLGWYSVYGQVVAATAFLAIVAHAVRVSAAGIAPTRAARRWWYALALVASTSFGVGIGAALALPLVLMLLFPQWRSWSRHPPLLSLLAVVPLLYVGTHVLFTLVSGTPIPGAREIELALGRLVGGGGAPPAYGLPQLAAAYLKAWPSTLWMLSEMIAYGCAQILIGFPSVAASNPVLWFGALAAIIAAGATAALHDPALRRTLLAFTALALGCYAVVALGRGAVLHAMGIEHPALAARYHYAATAPLVLAICVIAQGIGRRLAIERDTAVALLLVWLGCCTALYISSGPVIDHHLTARLATERVLGEIAHVSNTAPPDGPAYLANRAFAPTASTLSPIDFPGWGALFIAFSPDDTVDGRPLRFVIADPVVAQAMQHGRRSATLFTTPDQVPAGHLILQANAVDAGLIATPFGTPAR